MYVWHPPEVNSEPILEICSCHHMYPVTNHSIGKVTATVAKADTFTVQLTTHTHFADKGNFKVPDMLVQIGLKVL